MGEEKRLHISDKAEKKEGDAQNGSEVRQGRGAKKKMGLAVHRKKEQETSCLEGQFSKES